MNAPAPQAVLNAITALAMDVLSARVLTLLAMFAMLGLSCWAMYAPDYYHLGVLGIFGCLVFLPIIALERRQLPQGDSNG